MRKDLGCVRELVRFAGALAEEDSRGDTACLGNAIHPLCQRNSGSGQRDNFSPHRVISFVPEILAEAGVQDR